jgi:hypothetical protein
MVNNLNQYQQSEQSPLKSDFNNSHQYQQSEQ